MALWDDITRLFRRGEPSTEVPAAAASSAQTADSANNLIAYTIPRVSSNHILRRLSNQREEAPLIDFKKIDQNFQEESFVMQAITRYVELIFKSDWELKSKDAKRLRYVNQRIKEISKTMGQPFELFLIELGENLVKYNNCFFYKAWESNRTRIGAYFVLDTANTRLILNDNAQPKIYRQYEDGSEYRYRDFPAANTVHTVKNRPSGRHFGIPFLLPVLDDIRILRQIEASLIRTIHKNIEPLVQHVIGDDNRPTTKEEIEAVQGAIDEMPLDGQIVTSHRHKILVHGSQGEALYIDKYLRYFEQRVMTGLGMPETAFGRAATSNKSTAEQLSKELHDRIKSYQRIVSLMVNNHIIDDILNEPGAPKGTEDVYLEFNEIDFDYLIKRENHIIFKFTNNAITEDEMRESLGEEPIAEKDRKKLFSNLYGKATGGEDAANRNNPRNQHSEEYDAFSDPTLITENSTADEAAVAERSTMLSMALRHAYEGVWSEGACDAKFSERLLIASKQALSRCGVTSEESSYFIGAIERLGKTLMEQEISNGDQAKRVFMLGHYLLSRIVSHAIPSRLS